ncbi:helix-turn-helix domain-containing protein [Xanthobacter sp. V3C-3]|uniref:hypothetical protein n=1 Tax=Xanthobacter lutulentifluminis TaxID=3119935 RepID=UPI00372A7B33
MGAIKHAAGPAKTYTPSQRQAMARLANLRTLCWWRVRHGETLDTKALVDLIDLIVDAIRFLHGDGRHTLDRSGVLNWMPAPWRAQVPAGAIGRALEVSRPPWSVASNAEAGRQLRVRAVEIRELAACGSRIHLHAIDEDDTARASRRAADRRATRAEKRKMAGEGNETRCFLIKGEPRFVTFRRGSATAKILDLLDEGIASLGEITARTGTTPSAVKVALGRLAGAGIVCRIKRGTYALCTAVGSETSAIALDVLAEIERESRAPAPPSASPSPMEQAQEGSRDAAAGAVHSGPENPPDAHEPPREVAASFPASRPAEGADLGPDVAQAAELMAPTSGTGANDATARTEGAPPPHPCARLSKGMHTDAHVLALNTSAALRQSHEAARFATPILPSIVALSARLRAIRALVASSTAA